MQTGQSLRERWRKAPSRPLQGPRTTWQPSLQTTPRNCPPCSSPGPYRSVSSSPALMPLWPGMIALL